MIQRNRSANCELEDRVVEITQAEQERKKIIKKKKEDRLRDL